MHGHRWLRVLWMLLVPLLAGCGASLATAYDELGTRQIRVTATTGMVADLVRNVGGERVTVTALMGPGVDPHLYKPSARDILALENADVIVYGGLELEGRMTETFEKLERLGKATFAVSAGLDPARLIPAGAGYDPHIWFDVALWQEATKTVAAELSAIDPGSAALYAANAERYLAELVALDAYVQEQVATIPPPARVLITAHDAFGYFGLRYGFDVRGLQGSSTASEAGAGDVRSLADFIVDRGIKAIFVESSVPLAAIEAVQAGAQARGWDVAIGGELFSDALGAAGTPEGTYIGMVRHNIDTIAAALR